MALFVNPRQFQNDKTGRSAEGATYTFSESGGGTLKATYADAALTVPNSNPVVADGAGRFPKIYLSTDIDYRVVYSEKKTPSTFTIIWTEDGVSGPLDSTDAVTSIDSVADLSGLVGSVDGQQLSLNGYHPDSTVGGGNFSWSNGVHSGGTFIDPLRVFPTPAQWASGSGDAAVVAWYDTSGGAVDGWAKNIALPISANDFGYNETTEFLWASRASVTEEFPLDATGLKSYTANARFNNFDYGTPIDTTGLSDVYVAARWRVKKTNAADAVIASETEINKGGITLDITAGAGEFIYVRQLIPEIFRFNEKNLTAQINIDDAPTGFNFDWYILARFNNSDVERVVILDSNQFALPAGESQQSVTFKVPDLTATGYVVGSKNSLEFAFRLITDSVKTNAIVKINSISLVDGTSRFTLSESDKYQEEANALEFYEDVDFRSYNGLNDNARQRVQLPFTRKRLGISYTATLYDAVNNAGKISTYDNAGVRTDNITPLAVSNKNNSVEIIYLAPVGSTGIGARVVVNSEY